MSLPFVFSHQKSQDQVSHDLQKICEEMHCMKNKLQMLRENGLKSFLQESGDTYFLVLTNRSKCKFKEKIAIQYGVSNAFLPETTNFKEKFPELECKSSVSYNDS